MQIKVENFEGPLELLVKLIEDEELDITQISLIQVTEQYIGYLERVENRQPEMLADFLLIAAKLLYIKSKALLPEFMGEDEDEDVAELKQQLKIYKKYYDASKKVSEFFYDNTYAFGRLVGTRSVVRFIPSKSLTAVKLKMVFREIIREAERIKKLPQKSIKKIISIKQKIEKIRNLLKLNEFVKFKELLSGGHKQDIIVSFLGMLELAKQKELRIQQQDIFGEIFITKLLKD